MRPLAASVLATLLVCATAMAVEPGCAERVFRGDDILLDRVSGVRRLGSEEPITTHTAFRLASVSKQFTAAAILTLVEAGRLSLDARLADLLPGMPAYTRAITVRHLLTHTSGLPDYEVLMDEAAAHGGRVYTPTHQIDDAAVLRLLAATQAPRFAPGSRWAYSNSGYVVLGQIVAAVSGESFGRYLDQHVFKPHGLASTHLRVPGQTRIVQRAYGHAGDPIAGWTVSDQSSTSATAGDGGIYSTVEDLTRWLQALDRGESVLARHARDVFSATSLADGAATSWPLEPDEDNLDPGGPVTYGFGWFLDPAFGHRRAWHFGTTEGFRTTIEWFAEQHVGSVILCNRMDIETRARALANVQPYL
jgi:CubicO group peptidase (beta-lactamase class C family)